MLELSTESRQRSMPVIFLNYKEHSFPRVNLVYHWLLRTFSSRTYTRNPALWPKWGSWGRVEGLRLIQTGGRRVALGLNHLRPKRVRYGFVRRGGGITAQTGGREKRWRSGRIVYGQSGSDTLWILETARLRNHLVPAIYRLRR